MGRTKRIAAATGAGLLALAVIGVAALTGGSPPSEPAADHAVPTSAAHSAPLPGALIVHWLSWSAQHGAWDAAVTPIDAATAADLEARPALELGYGPSTSVSPDGRLLAVTAREGTLADDSRPTGMGAGRLPPWQDFTVYDLETWQAAARIESAPDLFADRWLPDGSAFLAWRDHCPEPLSEGRCGAAWQRELWRVDVEAESARRLATFDFAVMARHVSVDGVLPDRAYALAIRTDVCCGIEPEGDPFIAAIDLASGEIVAEIPLPGMLIGQPGHWLGDTSEYASYWPGTALAPDGSLLYVLDAVEDRVTVIDLQALQVRETVEIRERHSALSGVAEWLKSRFVSQAEAKGGPSYRRQLETTADGRHLLISGRRAESLPGGPHAGDRPAGLLIVDVESFTIAFRDAAVSSFTVSPDGRWLLGTGSYSDEDLADEHGSGGTVAHGASVIDLQSLQLVAHIWPGADVAVGGLSADSRYAYLTAPGPGLEAARRAVRNCETACTLLAVLDLQLGEIVAERLLDAQRGLISLTPD